MRCILYFSILLVSFFLNIAESASQQKLSLEINPGCNSCKNNSDILVAHVQSTGSNNTYHYLWSFLKGYSPTFLLFETDRHANLSIDWNLIKTNTKQNFVTFDQKVYNAIGIEMSSLYLIDEDTLKLLYKLPLEDFMWKMNIDVNDSNSVHLNFLADQKLTNETIQIKLFAFSNDGRSDSIPHLQYSKSSNLLTLILDDIDYSYTPENNTKVQPQLCANITTAFAGQNVNTMFNQYTSIDDEYTPGIFHRYVYNIHSFINETQNYSTSYIDWKPVAYYDESKVIAKSLKVIKPYVHNETGLESTSFLYGYFVNKDYLVQKISGFKFGSSDDGFSFQKDSYLEFTCAFGLGRVPDENLSMTLKIIIIVGFGVPMILFVISIMYTVIRKIRSSHNYNDLSDQLNN